MTRARLAWALALLSLGSCAHDGTAAAGDEASAGLIDRTGVAIATASAREEGGVTISVEADGLPAGTYAVHLHAVGRCDLPEFQSAGPHWNPTTRQHGRLNPLGPHLGDLPNLVVDTNGSGRIAFAIPGGSLRGANPLLDSDGAAIVIHANADDERTDPSGNSGARIACGVLG